MTSHIARPAGPGPTLHRVALALLGLLASLSARSEVYITLDEFGSTLTDPAFIASTGAKHQAEVDLQSGTIRAIVSASAPTSSGFSFDGRSLLAGIDQIVLTNPGANPVAAQAGFLSMLFEGSYSFGTGTSGDREAGTYADAWLSASRLPGSGGPAQWYEASVSVAHFWSDTPGQPFGFHSDAPQIGVSNGATVQVIQNDPSGTQIRLMLPALTLDPNDTLTISSQIFTGANAINGTAATNDYFNTARLSLLLPPGVSLSGNAGVPLDWVSTVPEPAALWLFGAGFAGLIGMAQRRQRVRMPAKT